VDIVGAVGSVLGAASSIVGNFQNARQETTLNAIEESTRYMKIGLVTQPDSLLNDSHVIRNTLTDIKGMLWDPVVTYLFQINVDLDAIAGDIHSALPLISTLVDNSSAMKDAITTQLPDLIQRGFDTLNVSVTATGVTTAEAAKALGNQIAANLSRQLVQTS